MPTHPVCYLSVDPYLPGITYFEHTPTPTLPDTILAQQQLHPRSRAELVPVSKANPGESGFTADKEGAGANEDSSALCGYREHLFSNLGCFIS